MAKKSVAEWCREVMLDENYGKIVAMMLQFDNGYSPKEIDNVTFGSRQWGTEELEQRFTGKCENYCGDTEGDHQFLLQAIYESSAVPRNEFRFTVRISGQGMSGFRTDAPTEKGILTQMMRHTEVLNERMMKMTQMTLDSCERQMGRMQDRVERAETENRDAWDIVREMGNKLMDKRNEHDLEQLKYKRTTELMAVWMKFGPALVNQILGRDVFPQDMADASLMEAIADSLDEDSIMKLSETLKPELWGVLSNRLTQVIEQKKLLAAHDEKTLSKIDDPEANAAGIVKSEYSDE